MEWSEVVGVECGGKCGIVCNNGLHSHLYIYDTKQIVLDCCQIFGKPL